MNNSKAEFSPFLDEEDGSKVYRFEEYKYVELGTTTNKIQKEEIEYDRYEVYLTNTIESSPHYSGLCSLLRSSKGFDVFNFYLANHGGSCHGLIALINAIFDAAGTINMIVASPSASAAATLALCGDSLTFCDHTFLMFHNYSSSVYGKGQELKDNIRASDEWINDYMRNLHQPFLTAAECSRIEKDNDVHVFYNDKTLDARIKRHFK